MDLKIFDGQDKTELSLIEVAHEILAQHGDSMAFVDLANEVQQYLGKTDEEFRERLSQFYTDLNTDGSFISLGDNSWGLRTWYPFESIDEAVIHTEDDEDDDRPKKKKRKKVNAFLADAADDDDVIDYDADDPEDDDDVVAGNDDDDFDATANNDDYTDTSKDDDDNDDLPDDDLPDGIEGQLSELDDDDSDDDE
ncbi:DNA-directed RNA polymerase subunit delta [Pediococcus damnosus]|uniref:DNA-directed RNA polymerase subunit delta n=1 Tax=Pediococcus damnosus TaxID=51663 RepID=UPI000704AA28|nr:DNA-directed RNA polymerase subunit delta [Pediococcus damnosus]